MKLVAVGANLPSRFGTPQQACQSALTRLEADGDIQILTRSGWWETAPVPVSDQPWYVNGVAQIETTLPPEALLARLHAVEAEMGRVRTVTNAARVIDLDLIAYDDRRLDGAVVLPHPRLHQRAFVLAPLCDFAPGWVHPGLGQTAEALLNALPAADRAPAAIRRAAEE
ncbi:2-amino-4-hydroxy-6-hydroxymethyldihydropteridine diphosphokinase [Novispirillum itersonii]|uniref:2-amino-4-hydroxy-6- hydroxymethyldihydropteridine diphosphokinase n=1 Tax=Novispirillum itersonii TaxID=189 RepID=UPI00036641AD|nr:2-amino-4-hydroxy-6-hydroxymethyldihydropteridine diphosphokinase [Novispirillum itersonii]